MEKTDHNKIELTHRILVFSSIKALTSMHKCIYSQESSLLAYCHDTQSLDLDEVSEQILHHLLARSESTSISRMVYTYVISTQIALADH